MPKRNIQTNYKQKNNVKLSTNGNCAKRVLTNVFKMEKTALTKLENWITKFEKIKGTPTICEIKAQIEMFKEIEKEQIEKAVVFGNRLDFYDASEEIGSDYYNLTYTKSSE